MIELALIVCCFKISSKFKQAGAKGASKYIFGMWLTLVSGMALGVFLRIAYGDKAHVFALILPLLIGYTVAIIIAVKGINKGESLLANITATSIANSQWTPTNPRLSSNRPFSSLVRVFAFTSGNGKTILKCPVALGTLSGTVGVHPEEVLGKRPFDIIARTDIGKQINQSGEFPGSAWAAMNTIAPDDFAMAQMGLYRTTVRPFINPDTRESGVWVLLYAN